MQTLFFVGEVAAFLVNLADEIVMFLVKQEFIVDDLDAILNQVCVGVIALVHKLGCKFLRYFCLKNLIGADVGINVALVWFYGFCIYDNFNAYTCHSESKFDQTRLCR